MSSGEPKLDVSMHSVEIGRALPNCYSLLLKSSVGTLLKILRRYRGRYISLLSKKLDFRTNFLRNFATYIHATSQLPVAFVRWKQNDYDILKLDSVAAGVLSINLTPGCGMIRVMKLYFNCVLSSTKINLISEVENLMIYLFLSQVN